MLQIKSENKGAIIFYGVDDFQRGHVCT